MQQMCHTRHNHFHCRHCCYKKFKISLLDSPFFSSFVSFFLFIMLLRGGLIFSGNKHKQQDVTRDFYNKKDLVLAITTALFLLLEIEPTSWNRRKRMTIIHCFYTSLQPFLQRRRLPVVITRSIFPLLLVRDYFITIVVVKILLAKVSIPHDARLLLLLKREELY